jgi:hypothetical protein
MKGQPAMSACVKCGSTDIAVVWHEERKFPQLASCGWGSRARSSQEHLHYYCGGCHYDWTGPTRDQVLRP